MKKRALLVGINDYMGINDLRGCINDVTNVRSILKTHFGFTNNDIRVLTDSRATKKNILLRLNQMVDTAKPGDSLIFHFSGHGSQIRDRDNDELTDFMDELICPYDMNWDDGFITDDMLRQILDKLKGKVKMEILLDSCHSGSGTRNSIGGPPDSSGQNPCFKDRYLEPPIDVQCRLQGDEDILKSRAFKTDKDIILNHVLWAGCKDNQTSADALIEGRYNGAFSYYFCKHVRENGGNITREVLHTKLVNSLNFHNYSQVPQLECKDAVKGANIFS
jgi:hypothetical protein